MRGRVDPQLRQVVGTHQRRIGRPACGDLRHKLIATLVVQEDGSNWPLCLLDFTHSRKRTVLTLSYCLVRVFHVQKVSAVGGSERHLLSLLPALAEAGVETHMCVPATGRAADFIDAMSELGVPHSTVRPGPDVNPLMVGALRREIRAYRPDLVHTHLVHADLHGQLAARLARVPGVSSVHGTPASTSVSRIAAHAGSLRADQADDRDLRACPTLPRGAGIGRPESGGRSSMASTRRSGRTPMSFEPPREGLGLDDARSRSASPPA